MKSRVVAFASGLGLTLLASSCSLVSEGERAADPGPSGPLALSDPIDTAGAAAATTDDGDGTVRLGLIGPVPAEPWNASVTSAAEQTAVDLLYDGLTTRDAATGLIEPALAESWALSEDQLVWTFVVRADAMSNDGSALGAADAVLSLERVLGEAPDSLAAAQLEVIEGASAVRSGDASRLSGADVLDAHTLTLTTTEPFLDLPAVLSAPVFGVTGPAVDPESRYSGAYEVDAVEGGWLLRPRAAAGRLIELRVFDDADQLRAALGDGDVDLAVSPPGPAAPAANDGGYAEVRSDLHASLYYGFNLSHPVLSSLRTRLAIVRGIERASVVDELNESWGRPQEALVPPGLGTGFDCGEVCALDVERARELAAPVVAEGPDPIPVDYLAGDDREEAVATVVADAISALGFDVELRAHELDDLAALIAAGEHGVFRFGGLGAFPSPAVDLASFVSGGADNVFALASEAFDERFAAALAEPDPQARRERYAAAEGAAMIELPVIPLVRFQSRWLVRDGFDGELIVGLDGTPETAGW